MQQGCQQEASYRQSRCAAPVPRVCPALAVEFGRKALFAAARPSTAELKLRSRALSRVRQRTADHVKRVSRRAGGLRWKVALPTLPLPMAFFW